MRVIYARMERTLDDNMPREQAGFRKRFSTIEPIFTISQPAERCREYKLPLCLLFIDLEKAFDSVEHNAVIRAMTDQGAEAAYVRILQETMRESYTEITLFERPLKTYMKRRVKQGDICSLKAITCALESVMRQVAEKDGFEINGETLQMLLFADNVVLVASRPVTLQDLPNEICHFSESIGSKIHPGKTKWMKNAHCDDLEIKLNNQLVERVEHYVYLGQAVRMDNDLRLELSRRRKAGWTAFFKIDVLLKNKDIPAQPKSHLFHSNMLSALLYGCEAWNLTKAEERSLQVTQRATEREMLGINKMEHRKNEEIREMSYLHEIVNFLHKRKEEWVGDVARMKDNRWTVRILRWYPRTTKRPTGRPPLLWVDPLWRRNGRTWTRLVQDREKWHGCELRRQWTRISST